MYPSYYFSASRSCPIDLFTSISVSIFLYISVVKYVVLCLFDFQELGVQLEGDKMCIPVRFSEYTANNSKFRWSINFVTNALYSTLYSRCRHYVIVE